MNMKFIKKIKNKQLQLQNFINNSFMFQINIPDHSLKKTRSNSRKLIEPTHQKNAMSYISSSRRNASSRSEFTKKNLSYVTLDSVGAVCPGHATRLKNYSNLSRNYFSNLDNPSFVVSNSNKIQAKQGEQNKKKKKLLSQSIGQLKIDKDKKKQVQNPKKSTVDNTVPNVGAKNKQKKTIKKQIKKQPTNKSKKNSQSITNTSTIVQKKGRNSKKIIEPISTQKEQVEQAKIFYKYSQPNSIKKQIKPFMQADLIEQYLEQSSNMMANKHLSSKNSRRSRKSQRSRSKIKIDSQVFDQSQFLRRQPTIQQMQQKVKLGQQKKQYEELKQKQQQQKATNMKLLSQLLEKNKKISQLSECYKNYQEAKYSHKMQLKELSATHLKQKEQANKEITEGLQKLQKIQEQCSKLQQQRNILIQKLNSEQTHHSIQYDKLLKQLSNLEQKYASLQNSIRKLQIQNEQLRSQAYKFGTEKQKYERTLKKYENQINQLQFKLQLEIKKNRSQQNMIETLKKDKISMKQNSELVLEIIRNQIKQCSIQYAQYERNTQKETNNENFGDLGKKMDNKYDINPQKHRILQNYNF